MATSCKICAHKQRTAIERALADPAQSNRSIAKQYGIVARTLDRHKNNCTRVVVAQTIARQERAIGVDLVDRVENLQTITEQILATSLHCKDGALALKAVSQARHNYRLIAQLTGKLTPADDETKRLVTFEEFSLIYRRVAEAREA